MTALPKKFSLIQEQGKLLLQMPRGSKLGVDFLSGEWLRRYKASNLRRQPIARAVGLSGKNAPRVLDATAGLARDAFTLVCLGCKVTAVERSPEIFALVEDAVRRAESSGKIASILQERLEIVLADSRELLSKPSTKKNFDVIYLDPMYPEKSKSSLAKQEMRDLRELLGNDEDSKELFDTAVKAAPKRIVVKRPPHAPPLAERVTHSFGSKLVRYDMYLVNP